MGECRCEWGRRRVGSGDGSEVGVRVGGERERGERWGDLYMGREWNRFHDGSWKVGME